MEDTTPLGVSSLSSWCPTRVIATIFTSASDADGGDVDEGADSTALVALPISSTFEELVMRIAGRAQSPTNMGGSWALSSHVREIASIGYTWATSNARLTLRYSCDGIAFVQRITLTREHTALWRRADLVSMSVHEQACARTLSATWCARVGE